MRKIKWIAIAVIFVALIFITGCTQIVSTAASASPGVSAQESVAASAPSALPTASPSLTPEVTQSPTASASASASASSSASAALASPTQSAAYKVAVPYDLTELKNSQKSVDDGHSPWKLDAAFVAQVFVSLQISPGGIVGDYPIPYEDFKVVKASDSDAVVEVNNDKSPTSKVYLKRLVRQKDGGIWTVVGYDPK